jgi:hypothetical protein
VYYPFIRGKQFELLMLREMAPKIAQWDFVPIIEPVKGNFPALKRALEALVDSNCHFIVIANPGVGELQANSSSLWREVLDDQLRDYANYSVGLNLSASETLDTAQNFFNQHSLPTAVIHCGFSDGKGLSSLIARRTPNITEHVFVEQHSTTLYRKHFKGEGVKRILVQDGFIVRNNRDYPPSEPFSELYLTYQDMGCDAFGDFLIVGSEYKDGGGPAYAIAIHLTYADPSADNAIAIRHYVSRQVDTPKDPAGKYLEALQKLSDDVRAYQSPILQTDAVSEYLQLYEEQHFPGLGYTKKLSMQHHLELIAHLLNEVE